MTRSPPWSTEENVAVVALYFEMLDAELHEQRYSKADHIRAVRGEPQTSVASFRDAPLANRSRGSIEFKLMNCTAAHSDIRHSQTTMHDHGYRALPNYQADLKATMKVAIEDRYFDRPAARTQA